MLKRAFEAPTLKMPTVTKVYHEGDLLKDQIAVALFYPHKKWRKYEAVVRGNEIQVLEASPSMKVKKSHRFYTESEAMTYLHEEIKERVHQGYFSIFSRRGPHRGGQVLYGKYPIDTNPKAFKGDKTLFKAKELDYWIDRIQPMVGVVQAGLELDPRPLEALRSFLKEFRDRRSQPAIKVIEELIKKARKPLRTRYNELESSFRASSVSKIIKVLKMLRDSMH
jgi:hypothetical protein